MASYQELSSALGSALEDLSVKKLALDEASSKVAKASDDYKIAMSTAQDLRYKLDSALSAVLPSSQGQMKSKIA